MAKQSKFIVPEVYAGKFTCPRCDAISHQRWQYRQWNFVNSGIRSESPIGVAQCDNCGGYTLWLGEKMLHPDSGSAPRPNTDMPESVLNVYLEATSIYEKSPRGAAALLRLAIQLLCGELGETGKDINSDIAALVRRGLPDHVQQALDIVRVTGNNAVHPGKIDIDKKETVEKLFELINIIIEYMISMPQRVEEVYSSLPDGSLGQIEKRDDNS